MLGVGKRTTSHVSVGSTRQLAGGVKVVFRMGTPAPVPYTGVYTAAPGYAVGLAPGVGVVTRDVIAVAIAAVVVQMLPIFAIGLLYNTVPKWGKKTWERRWDHLTGGANCCMIFVSIGKRGKFSAQCLKFSRQTKRLTMQVPGVVPQ